MEENIKIPLKPREGVYSDSDVYKAYTDVYETLHHFMLDATLSDGNLIMKSCTSIAIAKTKAIVAKAKILENMMKAVCIGYK